MSDRTRLIQIMLNLISNSVKFTKFGEIAIGANLIKNAIDNKLYVQLFVKDTGIGFKTEDLQKIINNDDNIIKINIDNNYNEMGTGLGISIVKRLLNKLGHRLDIKSTYGEGSEFLLIIENIVEKDYLSVDESNIKTKNLSRIPSPFRISAKTLKEFPINNDFTDKN